MDHWEKKLKAEASFLRETSLKYFDPTFMSLSRTHPLFTSCGTSPYQVSKAVIQARWLSGRARVESLTRHWDIINKEGICLLYRKVKPEVGTIEQFLLSGGCSALVEERVSMIAFFQAYMFPCPYLFPIFKPYGVLMTLWPCSSSLTLQSSQKSSKFLKNLKIQLLMTFSTLREVMFSKSLWQEDDCWELSKKLAATQNTVCQT